MRKQTKPQQKKILTGTPAKYYDELETERQRYVQMKNQWLGLDMQSDHYKNLKAVTLIDLDIQIQKCERLQRKRIEKFCSHCHIELLLAVINDTTLSLSWDDIY